MSRNLSTSRIYFNNLGTASWLFYCSAAVALNLFLRILVPLLPRWVRHTSTRLRRNSTALKLEAQGYFRGSMQALSQVSRLHPSFFLATVLSRGGRTPWSLSLPQWWAAGTGTNCLLPNKQNKLLGPDDLNQIVLQECKNEAVEQLTKHTTTYFSQMLLWETVR